MSHGQSADAPGQRRVNTYELRGRMVLVTGGLGGLGTSVSLEFARAGAEVVIAGSQERPSV